MYFKYSKLFTKSSRKKKISFLVSSFFFSFLGFIIFISTNVLFADGWESSIWKDKTYRNQRISSADPTNGNDDFIKIPKKKTVTIAEIKTRGVIKHIWMTLASKDLMARKNAVIRIYWDNHKHPSVEVPLGEFFGQGWGEEYILNSAPLVAAPKKGKSMNSYFPMPFETGAKIEIENESDEDISNFYFYIDYEEWKEPLDSSLRFHAQWNRSITQPNTSNGKENEWALLGETEKTVFKKENYFSVLETEGKGQFVGLNLYVDSPTPLWYGEGDDLIFIDGNQTEANLKGTGTEDVFNTAWSPKEVFMHPYFGYPRVSDSVGWLGRTHLYRFWVESPIRFEKNFLFLLEHGHANSLTLDLTSVAYWYQSLIPKPMKVLPKKEFRVNKPEINFRHIHKWRDSFRSEKGYGEIWGNE
ncbi:PF11175 family protein [Leptospira wolbachii serovar Codice str. CDC]|uniref:PF11175 family protein n=1 Tax=Leptospira wolbachii serovar Codice str. CDC TaxID=1218599 RepID=R9A354_9LEPT|nr:glycoside hydrolase family 172 protein [Leptospira wolbachii]EOQ96646.1 PF11175 family protein [Leptospira wolbachii serovar Codice str. CDC]